MDFEGAIGFSGEISSEKPLVHRDLRFFPNSNLKNKVALIDSKSVSSERAYTKADLNCYFQVSRAKGTCLKSKLKLLKLTGKKCISGEIGFEKALVYRNLRILPNSNVKNERT